MDENKTQLACDYDASAEAYELHWGPALAVLAENFVDRLDLSNADRVLDVGAGTGRLVSYLSGKLSGTAFGIDQSLGMLRRSEKRGVLAVMDAEHLGFADDVFDAVVAMFMLFHLPDPLAGLQEIRRVLRRGGIVALTTWGDDDPDFPAFGVFDEVLDRYGAAPGRSLYAKHELVDSVEKCERLLQEAGFSVGSVYGDKMNHQWTVDDVLGFRTRASSGRVRAQSLSEAELTAALDEGRQALEALSPDELTLRDEVIYSIGIA